MHRTTVLILVLALTLSGCAPLPGAGSEPSPLEQALQPLVDEWRDVNGVPGLALVVSTGDGQWATVTSGTVDLDTEKRVTGKELFDAGTIAETFVAAAVLQLAGEGRVDLDAPLSTYLPALVHGPRITVRQLLAHRSGLFDLRDDAETWSALVRDLDRAWAADELLALAGQHALYFEPGTTFRQTDTNYMVAAALVEAVTGTDLATYLRQHLFEPLALNDTFVTGLEAKDRAFVSGYLLCQHELATALLALYGQEVPCQAGVVDLKSLPGWQRASFYHGASGVVSSARDLAAWARALYAGPVLGVAGREEMLRLEPGGANYGLGAMLFANPTATAAWGHTGSATGVESILVYSPELDVALVAWTNIGGVGNLAYLTDSALDIVASQEPAAGAEQASLEELRLALQDGDPEARRQAASALGHLGPEAAGAAPDLIRLLAGDPDWQVREAAAIALGQTGPETEVTAPLRDAALNDAHERVQWAAQLALSRLQE